MNRTPSTIATKILKWYDSQGRKDLPWRKTITPYRVWISEIMLQQTQVITVLPYFKEFIKQFPTIEKLAATDEDNVLHLWSGLGYYSRARNLHKTAKIIMEEYHVKFPDDIEILISLPGIGRSTAGAILAIAFQKQAAILDGNVRRILTRLHAVEGWPGESLIQKKLWALAENYTPKHRVNDYTQAIMDLGALICTRRNPLCGQCPLIKNCLAHQLKIENTLPTPKPKKIIPSKSTLMLIIHNEKKEMLLLKRPSVGIWGGLWSFPECSHETDINDFCGRTLGLDILEKKRLASFKHTFSHYHLQITPIILECTSQPNLMMEPQRTIWFNNNNHEKNNIKLGIPAPVTKILRSLL